MNPDRFQGLIFAIEAEYSELARRQDSGFAYEVLSLALTHLPRLRKVTCLDGFQEGIHQDITFMPPSLQALNQYFPLSDRAMRTLYSSVWRPSSDGFFSTLRAISLAAERNPGIQHLRVHRSTGLMKQGIPWEDFLHAKHRSQIIDGFRHLKTLNLCIDLETAPGEEMVTQVNSDLSSLSAGLCAATSLTTLEILLTCNTHTDVPMEWLIPVTTFPNLHTVSLEAFTFTPDEISDFVFLQPQLRNLSLRRPHLNGDWKEVLDRWSQKPEFVLETVEIQSPSDLEMLHHWLGAGGSMVGSRISNEAIRDFINNGGKNPFEERRWTFFDRDRSDSDDGWSQNFADGLSDFSDMSEWLPREHPEPPDDIDGPEYDSEYDFDGEDDDDSNAEMEENGEEENI